MTFSDNNKKPVENYNPGSITASVAFVQSLISESAFINYLFTKQFTLHGSGIIQSENYSLGESGFIIKADGDAEFNNGKFRGHIEATSGYMDDITIGRLAVFEGTVDSGPIYASNEIQTPPAGRTWGSNTLISTIRTDLGVGSIPENGSRTVNFSSGSFGSKTGLKQLNFISKFLYYRSPMVVAGTVIGAGYNVYGLKLEIVFNDNTVYTFEDTMGSGVNVNEGKINNTLTVGGGAAGKTLKFKDLPGSPDGLVPGSVYRNGNQLMIV